MSSLLSLSNRQGSHNDRPARDQGDCPSCPVRAVLIVDHFGHFCPLAKRQGSPENRPAASLPRAVDGGLSITAPPTSLVPSAKPSQWSPCPLSVQSAGPSQRPPRPLLVQSAKPSRCSPREIAPRREAAVLPWGRRPLRPAEVLVPAAGGADTTGAARAVGDWADDTPAGAARLPRAAPWGGSSARGGCCPAPPGRPPTRPPETARPGAACAPRRESGGGARGRVVSGRRTWPRRPA